MSKTDKIVEEIAKIIEARDNEIVESVGLCKNDIGDVKFPEEIAQAIYDSLELDVEKIMEVLLFEENSGDENSGDETLVKYTKPVKSAAEIAHAIAKRKPIKIRAKKR